MSSRSSNHLPGIEPGHVNNQRSNSISLLKPVSAHPTPNSQTPILVDKNCQLAPLQTNKRKFSQDLTCSEDEKEQAAFKQMKLLHTEVVNYSSNLFDNKDPSSRLPLTDKLIIERLQSQNSELANERTKMREGIIMSTFQQRIKEDEWKEKERKYLKKLEECTTKISSLEQQLNQMNQNLSVTQPRVPLPKMATHPLLYSVPMTSSSSSSSSSSQTRKQPTPPRLLCTYQVGGEKEKKNSLQLPSLSTLNQEKENDTQLNQQQQPTQRVLLQSARRGSFQADSSPSESPSKIQLPPASSILDDGLYVDELNQLLHQKEEIIHNQESTIHKLEEEIESLKQYSSKLSSRQNRPPRTGNKLGKRYDFPKEATVVLKQWMISHTNNPYPSKEEKDDLAKKTGLTVTQLNDWMTNYRRRNIRKHGSPTLAGGPNDNNNHN